MCTIAECDYIQLLKGELSRLQSQAVAERQTIVPMVAALQLPAVEDEVVSEIANMHSVLSGNEIQLNSHVCHRTQPVFFFSLLTAYDLAMYFL